LNDKNPVVKAEALGIALQYSGKTEQRKLFEGTDLIKSALRLHSDERFTERAISVLINFTQDEFFRKEVLEAKGVSRIIETLKDHLAKYDYLVNKTGKASDPNEESKAEEGRFTEDQFILVIQLDLLFLSNLSHNDQAREQVLELDREPEFHGLHVSLMLNWFSHPKLSPFFHFFANVVANLTSDKKCREFLLEPKFKLFDHITSSVYSADPNRRLGTLKVLRNCFFEYENEIVVKYVLSPEHKILNSLLKCLAFVLAQTLSLVKDAEKFQEEAVGICKSLKIDTTELDKSPNIAQSLEEIDIVVDVFVVLTNLDPEKYQLDIDLELLRKLLGLIPKVTSKEEIKNKTDVIYALILKENTFGDVEVVEKK